MSCVARKLSGATSSVNASPLILSDFYRWVLNRTDLNGIAQEMMIKEGAVSYTHLTLPTKRIV